MTDQQKIEQLQSENQQLKQVLKEGKEVFSNLQSVLGLEKAANSSFFASKIATILMRVQRNPEMFEDVTTFAEKINKLEL